MTHIKVWLIVGLTVVVAGMAWFFPTEESQRVKTVQEQLVPLQKSRALHVRIHNYQQKLLKRVQRIARHKKIKTSLQPLVESSAEQGWNWRGRKAHRQSIKNLAEHAALLKKASKYKKIYIFSKQRRLLVSKGKVLDFQKDESSMSHLPMVSAALTGKVQVGLWSHNKNSHFMVSAPVYGTKQVDDDDDEPQKIIVGAVLVTQAISNRLFRDWGWKNNDKNAPLLMLFNRSHPLLYRVPGAKQASVSKPPKARGKAKTASVNPLEQAFKHWSARRFARFVGHAAQGTYTSSQPVKLQGKSYYYAVGRLPAPINDGKVGYVMLSPVQRISAPFYTSRYFILAAITILLASFLGIWFTLGWKSDRKRLQILLTDMLADPDSLKSVKQIPASYVFLFQYLRPLARRLQSSQSDRDTRAPMPQAERVVEAPAQRSHQPASEEREKVSVGAPDSRPPQNTVEAIRALSADGSIKLPQRPKGMTYIQGGSKDKSDPEVDASPLSMLQEEASDNSMSNPLPSFISSNEADNIVPSQPEPSAASLLANTEPKGSSTPMPNNLGLPMAPSPIGAPGMEASGLIDDQPEDLSLPFHSNDDDDDDLFAGLEMPEEDANEGQGVLAGSLPLTSNSPSPLSRGSSNSPLSTLKSSIAHEAPTTSMPKEATASKLPIIGAQSDNPLSVHEKQPVGHLNLTSELDSVFSMIAGPMTPAPPSQPSEPAPSISLPNDSGTDYPMEENHMRKVFQDYLDMRKSCGEPTQNIQWDSFVELLRNQKASILQQYSCRDVQFYVQEKDGRASLKATPVK